MATSGHRKGLFVLLRDNIYAAIRADILSCVLRPGAILMLGTAETTMNLVDGFELVRSDGTSYYRAA